MVRKARPKRHRIVYDLAGGEPEDARLNDPSLTSPGITLVANGVKSTSAIKAGGQYTIYLHVKCACGQTVSQIRRYDANGGGTIDVVALQIITNAEARPIETHQSLQRLGKDEHPVDCTHCGRQQIDGRALQKRARRSATRIFTESHTKVGFFVLPAVS